jgi:hypothetical protein
VVSLKIGSETTISSVADGEEVTYLMPIDFLLPKTESMDIMITVTRDNKDIGEYKLTVHRGDKEDGTARLSSLTADPTQMSPTFVPDTDVYEALNVAGAETIELIATPETPADKITVRHTTSDNMDGSKDTEVQTGADGFTKTYTLSKDGEVTDVFFITVEAQNGELTPHTYVMMVKNVNPVWLTDLAVVDETDENDSFYELTPEFKKSTLTYEVKVPALATDITFEASSAKDDEISVLFGADKDNITATGTLTQKSEEENLLTITKELATSTDAFVFEFDVTGEGGVGKYIVNVKRETPGPLLLQTTIKAQVSTLSANNHATVEIYRETAEDGKVLYNTLDLKPEEGETTFDGRFEFTPSEGEEGTYSMIIKRSGYMNYYINDIVVDKTYVKAEYDFGKLAMIAGDIVTYGNSKDKIDAEDLKYFKRLMNGADVTQAELDGTDSSNVVYSVNVKEEDVYKTDGDETEVTKPDDKTDGNETEVTKPDDKTDSDETEVTKPDDKTDGNETEVTKPDDKTDGNETEVTKPDDDTDAK